MAGFEAFVRIIQGAGVEGDLWVDGSFLTEKIEPKDVDLVLHLDGEFDDNASPAQATAIDWLNYDLMPGYYVDSHVFTTRDKSHPDHTWGEDQRAYWTDWWGHSRSGEKKGIAVISVSEAKL